MGTFHQDRGELHGITVVVETTDGRLIVGRCDRADETAVTLWDADMAPSDEEAQRRAWLERAIRVGVWPRHPRLSVPRGEIASVRRLAELEVS